MTTEELREQLLNTPKNGFTKLTAEQRADVEKLQEKLEEDDDIVNVYHTMAEADEDEE